MSAQILRCARPPSGGIGPLALAAPGCSLHDVPRSLAGGLRYMEQRFCGRPEVRRFQNDGSLGRGVEYRYSIRSNLDALVFVNTGQVFDALTEEETGRLQWSHGEGLHF